MHQSFKTPNFTREIENNFQILPQKIFLSDWVLNQLYQRAQTDVSKEMQVPNAKGLKHLNTIVNIRHFLCHVLLPNLGIFLVFLLLLSMNKVCAGTTPWPCKRSKQRLNHPKKFNNRNSLKQIQQPPQWFNPQKTTTFLYRYRQFECHSHMGDSI